MGEQVSQIFGGGAPGPDDELIAAQKRQAKLIEEQEAQEQAELQSRQRLLAARQGRRSASTLFAGTGEAGVKSETLGG